MWVVLLEKQLILLLFHKRAELNSRISLPYLHLSTEVRFKTALKHSRGQVYAPKIDAPK